MMFNLSMFCFLSLMFFGVVGMLGYVLSAYQRLLEQHNKLLEQKKSEEKYP